MRRGTYVRRRRRGTVTDASSSCQYIKDYLSRLGFSSLERLKNGLRLVKIILKHRYNGEITAIAPSMVKQYVRDATENDVNDVEYALRYLETQGFVVRVGKSRFYMVLPSLMIILDERNCLNNCESESGLCGFYATWHCPFLEGITGGGDD